MLTALLRGSMASLSSGKVENGERHKSESIKTKKFLRTLFSSYYMADDFEEDEIELGFSFLELLKIWKAQLFGTFKTWGKWLSWKQRRNLQDRPFNKDGEECKSAYDKLF